MFFSIIVPVYKVEDYLCECLDSILAQTFTDFEAILIDDGSPDNCGKICDEYAEKDSRIKVIHQCNGGLSAARNAGLDVAEGEYVVFVDSDDWITNDALDNINRSIKKYSFPDIMETILDFYYSDGHIEQRDANFDNYIKENGFNNTSALKWMSDISKDKWAAPKKIVKNELIKCNHLRFFVDRLHEDMEWTPKICMFANSFGCFSGSWYCYRFEREGSITYSINSKNIIDEIKTVFEYYNYTVNEKSETSICFLKSLMTSLCYAISRMNPTKENINIVSEEIKNHSVLFSVKNTKKRKHKIFCLFVKTFGAKQALRLLYKYK